MFVKGNKYYDYAGNKYTCGSIDLDSSGNIYDGSGNCYPVRLIDSDGGIDTYTQDGYLWHDRAIDDHNIDFSRCNQDKLPDSGDRTEFDTGAVRDAMTGKGLPSLIPPEALRRLARRFEDGAVKYGRDNWMKGIPLSRYHDAIIRHTLAAAEGQTDEDHLGAVLWNAAAWIWTESQISSGQLPDNLDDRTYTNAIR